MPDILRFDPEARYDCTACGLCCSGDLAVHATTAEKLHMEQLPWDQLPDDERVQPRFERAGGDLWKLPKQGDDPPRCIFLLDDASCVIHKHWGPTAKPAMCRRFPFQHVASDEAVWVSACFGCPGVAGGAGRPLEEHREDLASIFDAPLAEASGAEGVRYPLTPDARLPDPEVQAVFDTVLAGMGCDVFGAMRQLAAFAAAAPEPGEPQPAARPADASEIPSQLRFAFALSLYRDAVDASSFLGRLGAVLTLPRMLAFGHSYRSRLLDMDVDMAAVLGHPGTLPAESSALLAQVLRSRLHGRLVFSHVPSAVSGISRSLLELCVVLYLARALAMGRSIQHGDVLRALEVVELHISSQTRAGSVARLDPRLAKAWADPTVALAAAQLFTPVEG